MGGEIFRKLFGNYYSSVNSISKRKFAVGVTILSGLVFLFEFKSSYLFEDHWSISFHIAPRFKSQIPNAYFSEKLVRHLAKLRRFDSANCSAIFNGSRRDTDAAIKRAERERTGISDQRIFDSVQDCQQFISDQGFVMNSLTDEERDFPIAYSILTFKNAEMVTRLLRSIYRPQNYYCIHVDTKANKNFKGALKSLAGCFPNVFLSSRSVDVQWAKFTVLEPELICLKDLTKYPSWKYFINLTGQEFPLQTNLALVRILRAFKGANSVRGTVKKANKDRWKSKPPHGIQPVKGSVHVVLSRQFVVYMLQNQTSLDLLKWVRKTGVPDETYFATLNFNPQLEIPGTYTGTQMETMLPFNRYKIWSGSRNDPLVPCAGYSVRTVCILSTGDLVHLGRSQMLFANKFHLEKDRVAIGCLEEKLFSDVRDQYLGLKNINTSNYENQDFVKNHVMPKS